MANPRIPASHRDLLESADPVALATVGPTGHPQVTAIWAILDGDLVVTSLAGVRQKLRNLTARPQATVFAIDPANPYRTLEVRGDVTIEPDPELATPKRRSCGPTEPTWNPSRDRSTTAPPSPCDRPGW